MTAEDPTESLQQPHPPQQMRPGFGALLASTEPVVPVNAAASMVDVGEARAQDPVVGDHRSQEQRMLASRLSALGEVELAAILAGSISPELAALIEAATTEGFDAGVWARSVAAARTQPGQPGEPTNRTAIGIARVPARGTAQVRPMPPADEPPGRNSGGGVTRHRRRANLRLPSRILPQRPNGDKTT